MAGLNNFDVASMVDRERQRLQQIEESRKDRAMQSTATALNTVGSVLGMFFPAIGGACQAAAQGVQLGGAASKQADIISRTKDPSFNSEGRLNGVHYTHQSNLNVK